VEAPSRLELEVDGRRVEVPASAGSLLDALRDHAGVRSPKDGCSPQGQCGCCTVLVDGAPRVSCVTPVRRVAGRRITTVDGLAADERQRWADAFCATGGSQCGFCTPGIIVRLSGLQAKGGGDEAAVDRALAAHLCRCTGWRTIHEAWRVVTDGVAPPGGGDRDLAAASRRATIEGRTPQRVGPEVALGEAGFADDTAPLDALVAVPDGAGGWAVGETLAEARAAAGKVQGRRTTAAVAPPLALPGGDWAVSLRTSWVEPAYLETDASWCAPGGEPATPLANGGAFGGKARSPVAAAARALADRHGRAVRVLLSREDTVRLGPKRPPIAAGLREDGSGVLRAAATDGLAPLLAQLAPELAVEEVPVPGPPTSLDPRAVGWAELALLRAGLAGAAGPVVSPEGAVAEASVGPEGIAVRVRCGAPLDEVVLRSYCIGAAHMALGWVTSEGLAVDAEGEVHDLTIRSFGVVRSADVPPIEVEIEPSDEPPVNGSDAVFAAVAAALWVDRGCPTDLPDTVRAGRGGRP
jgi:aerobic-type carbon monoxide dehydrogenase small subunit (CoxS/CutS family)